MMRFHSKSLIKISIAFLSVFIFSSSYAQDDPTEVVVPSPQESTVTTTTVQPSADGTTTTKTVETRRTITTTLPTPNNSIAPPPGFASCVTVDAGWQDEVWIPSHKVCTYNNFVEGSAWIEGYWKCNKATPEGVCTIWEWQDGYWSKTVPAY